MIIQIRGTSGSGKTTVMRAVMQSLKGLKPHFIEGRRQPLYYHNRRVAVLGHYEVACGGCDTIGSAPKVFELVTSLAAYPIILSEGLLLSEDAKWTPQMPGVRVVFLTTPGEECLRRVAKRQQEKERTPKDQKRLEYNLTHRMEVIDHARTRLVGLGIPCVRCSSKQASRLIIDWLKENV